MIKGVGIDAVDISRMRAKIYQTEEGREAAGKELGKEPDFIQSPFAGHVFSDEELTIARSRRDPAVFLAGCFAVKEAVFKVLSPLLTQQGKPSYDLRRIHSNRRKDGSPQLVLDDDTRALLKEAGLDRIDLSITNEKGMAIAIAVGSTEDRETEAGSEK